MVNNFEQHCHKERYSCNARQFITEMYMTIVLNNHNINIESSLPSKQLPISCQCHGKVRSAEDTYNTKALQFVDYPRRSAAITASMTKLAIIPITPWPDCAWKCTNALMRGSSETWLKDSVQLKCGDKSWDHQPFQP